MRLFKKAYYIFK